MVAAALLVAGSCRSRRRDVVACQPDTLAEYHQLSLNSYLDIPSPGHAGRFYRIPRGPGQVLVYEDGHVFERLCVQPVENLPEADVILAHKLLIEADESTYLQTANHFPRSIWR